MMPQRDKTPDKHTEFTEFTGMFMEPDHCKTLGKLV